MLRLLVQDGAPKNFVHRLAHHHPVARGERDEGVGQCLNIPNQIGVEDEWIPTQVG